VREGEEVRDVGERLEIVSSEDEISQDAEHDTEGV